MVSNSVTGNVADKSANFSDADKSGKTFGNSLTASKSATETLARLPTDSTLQTPASTQAKSTVGNGQISRNYSLAHHIGDGVVEAGKTVWGMVEGIWTLGSGAVKTVYDTNLIGWGFDAVRKKTGHKLTILPSQQRGLDRLSKAGQAVKAVINDPGILIQDYKKLAAEGRYGAITGRAAVDILTLGIPVSKIGKLAKLNRKSTNTVDHKTAPLYQSEHSGNGKMSKEMEEELLKIEKEFSVENRIPKGHDFKLDEIEPHPARTENPPVEATIISNMGNPGTKNWADYIVFKQDPPVQVLRQPDGKKLVKPTEHPDPAKPVLESSRYNSSCGPTCASMISIDRGVNIHPSTFEKLARTDSTGGTSSLGLSDALNEAGIPSINKSNQTIDDLAKGVEEGHSAIVAVHRYQFPFDAGSQPAGNSVIIDKVGHAVVVDRVYTTKGANGPEKWVEFRDPYYGEHITMDANHFSSFMMWGITVYTKP